MSLPSFSPFECSENINNVAQRWARWMEKLDNMLTAMDITDAKRKLATLKHYMGDEVHDIFITLPDTGDDYDSAVNALNSYFGEQHNTEFEVFQFRKIEQQKQETLTQFATRLKKAAVMCDFGDVDREVKAQIILTCRSNKIRRYALQHPNIELSALLKYGRTLETTERHATALEDQAQDRVNAIQARSKTYKEPDRMMPSNSDGKAQMCKFCGDRWHSSGIQACKARGQNCNYCGKPNHFAKACLTKQQRYRTQQKQSPQDKQKSSNVNYLESSDDSSSDDFVLSNSIIPKEKHSQHETVTLNFNETNINLIIDSGATVNILNAEDYAKISHTAKLENAKTHTFAYGSSTPLEVKGVITLKTTFRNTDHNIKFQVVKEKGPSLIGKRSAVEMGLIKFINTLDNNNGKIMEAIVNKHTKLFMGLGKLKQVKVKLNIDAATPPVIQKLRRIPYRLRDKVEQELKELLQEDIIEKVPSNIPTPWTSPIVPLPKTNDPNKVRICIDMREANKAILRERFITPTVADVTYSLNGSKHFTKLDLNKGYHQLELDEESRSITTFVTHKGLYRYKRLHFGVNTASDIFQHEITKLLSGIPNVLNVSDDILIYGKTIQEHNDALEQTLTRLEQGGITLNKSKCRFNKETLKFLGHIFTSTGMSPDPAKTKYIAQMKEPKTQSEVRSLLGTITFCAQFIPHLALTAKPLRMLTKKSQEWQWTEEHQAAFDKIKQQLTEATKVAYFDKDKTTEIWTDAGPVGVGAILAQRDRDGKPYILAFASHALSETEQRYAQIEKEALALVWATKHFHLYVYGHEFKIITDHKPLIYLFNDSKNPLSVRLERWRVKLQPYKYTVEYRPGKINPSDYLSRHPSEGQGKSTQAARLAEHYVSFVIKEVTPKTITIEDVKQHTAKDATLMKVIANLKAERWDISISNTNINQDQFKSLLAVKQELSTNHDQNILLRGTRLVIPQTLQQDIVKVAHAGHQGICKTKALLREKVWFTGIDRMVEGEIKQCIPCNSVTKQNTTAIPILTTLPDGPWQELNIDHKGPLPSGDYLLVLVDQFSRFPIIEIVGSTSAKINIEKLESIFSTFGIPNKVTTDNGAPFNSQQFKEFRSRLGIHHHKIIPRWPQANGLVERFNGTINKILQIAYDSGPDWKQQLHTLLRNYRETPQRTTGRSPSQLIFGYKQRTQIPDATQLKHPLDIKSVQEQDIKAKNKCIEQFSRNKMLSNAQTPQLGNRVLVKQAQPNKLTPMFDSKPYMVTQKKGTMITAAREDRNITRHQSQFKVLPDMSVKVEQAEAGVPRTNKTLTQKETAAKEDLPIGEDKEARKPEEILTRAMETCLGSPSVDQSEVTDNRETDVKKGGYNLRGNISKPKRLIEQ